MVYGDGPGAGAPLVEHSGVNMVSFTGSTEIGKQIGEIGGRHNKRVSLEMGGKNPIIVLDDANLALAVEGAFGARLAPADSAALRPHGCWCRRKCTTHFWSCSWRVPAN